MEIQLKLYGSSKLLSENELLKLELPENSNVEQLRNSLKKLISEKHSQSNLGELSKTAAFFSENDEEMADAADRLKSAREQINHIDDVLARLRG